MSRNQQKPVIIVHGGTGAWHTEREKLGLKGVKEAAKKGFEVLDRGENAVECVEEAVSVMEDEGIFNAGYGSSFNIERKIEMEAAIMEGKTLKAGAVGLLKDIKNPVHLAKTVMEKTDHVLLIGEGAEKLANISGLEKRNPETNLRLRYYEKQKKAFMKGNFKLPKLADLVKKHPELFEFDTVGAVALDKIGNVAAATSTGGFSLKIPGRIGDSPLIGSGTYADDQMGACSATGVGEIALRLVLAKTTCDFMENMSAQEAVMQSILLVDHRLPDIYNAMGLIAVDMKGRIGAAHNTPHLCWAYVTPNNDEPIASLNAKIIK